jgi:cellulose synthase (UDP-forming)
MADVPERESYFGESDAGEHPALGGEPRARTVAVAEARQAPADLGAGAEQVRQDSVVELAAHFRRLSGELSETRCRLERAEAKLARSELARAQAEGRARGAERIVAEAAERAGDAKPGRDEVVARVTRERDEAERELIAARSRLERLAERAARRAQRRTREQAGTQLSAELATLESEAEEPSVQAGKDAAARSRAADDMRLREEEALVRLAEDQVHAEAEQRLKELERGLPRNTEQQGFVEARKRSTSGRQPSRISTHMRGRGKYPGAPPTGRRPDDEMSHRRLVVEAWVSGVALILTVLAFGGFLVTFGATLEDHVRSPLGVVSAVVFLLIVGFLVYGALVYLLSRLGYMRRRVRFRHASADELRRFTAETDATVTLLVPSYKEEPGVVRQTLLSAALQEYPHRRVVLLIDDPPNPSSEEDARSLASARELPGEVNALLARTREPFARAARRAERRALRGQLDRREATAELADLFWRAAGWFRAQAALSQLEDNAGALFLEMNLREPARRHAATAALLHDTLAAEGDYPTEEWILRSYRELGGLFTAEVTSFERKRYANLSHAPNKAMNLNSYIALMGCRIAERPTRHGRAIHEVSQNAAGFEVPDAEYVLTLDADSLLEPRYMVRLVHFLERPENSRIAVAQTPYSAIPDAARSIERIAGATTDIQYVIHQGFTVHGATYWVGANALLRKRALEDIATTVRDERTGADVVRYIQDRTVIEDTESSVDLLHRGWGLFNYPARLSYTATPPDFGSLVVQRRRWANGGLLILPKLLRIILRRSERPGPIHAFMRFHYLVSVAAVNIGLVVLFVVPFADWYANVCLPLTAAPYFALYTHDLRLAGYRARDVVKVYALNLMLVPVNLGGVARSVWQAITGRGTPFLRTPKVRDRTTAPALYIVLPYMLIFMLLFGGTFSVVGGHELTGVASGVNALLLLYAVRTFIGWRHSREDLTAKW